MNDAPSDPALGSKTRVNLLDPHYLGYRLVSRFLPSEKYISVSKTRMIEVVAQLTSNAMWSFPIRISSSCLPTMFFFGQFVSSSLRKMGE